ncbi:hypothetical protein L3X38_018739 [Prunus dulcis]|uniref:Uncharacterized protein n=1 Tax=Prunus dulcis TaxID=3755 RepID=A0AAD4WCA1_PRUDU|nr:hypothetical protein L3X38_018739 [Prunus dulcis]
MRRSTGETPFCLAYGTEAIIPPHITVPSIRIEVGRIEQNSEQMRLNLDLLEGKDLILEVDNIVQGIPEGGALDVAIYDDDFGVAANVCEQVFVHARLVGVGVR